jgi:hypothetical protein
VSCVKKFRRILANLKKIVHNVTHSFYDIDNMEVFNAEADILISETKKVADYVTTLVGFADNEAFAIVPCGDLPALLHQLTEFVTKLLDGLQGIQRMLQLAPINLTHLKFAEYLKPGLSECAKEIQCIIGLVEKLLDHMDIFAFWGRYLNSLFDRFRILWCHQPSTHNNNRYQPTGAAAENTSELSEPSSPISQISSFPSKKHGRDQISSDDYREKLLMEYSMSVRRLSKIIDILVRDFADVRMNFVWHKVSHPFIHPSNQLDSSKSIGIASDINRNHNNRDVRLNSNDFSNTETSKLQILSDDSDARIFISLEKHLQSMMRLHNIPVEGNNQLEEDIAKIIDSETEHLSIKNISYRSAYMSRLIFVSNLLSDIESMFLVKYVKVPYQTVFMNEYYRLKDYITTFFHFKLDMIFLESLIQPAKIAGAVTITAIFVVYPGALGIDIENALWPGITLCFIRNENSASSFLASYQRLEGTVIGSFFVLFVYVVLAQTPTDDYGQFSLSSRGPLVVAWVAICCYFREGTMHGFTAVTAAITPIVLLMGPFTNSISTLLSRYID